MMQISLLMFSRSFSKDYRWVYCPPGVTQNDKDELLKDYRAFELNREYFLSEKHLILRSLEGSTAVFRFSKTGQTDNCSRPIFAMTGLVFSGIDAEILLALPQFILSVLFYSEALTSDRWKVADSIENRDQTTTLSLDYLLDEYRKNPELRLLAEKLHEMKAMLANNSVLITREGVSPMKSESYSTPTKTQYSASFDEMLKPDGHDGSTGKNGFRPRQDREEECYNEKRGLSLLSKALDAVVGWFSDWDD